MIQYYGEHVSGDGRLDSLPAMTRLVTTLSPHFTRAYLFSAFGLIDAGRPDVLRHPQEGQGESRRVAVPRLSCLLRLHVRRKGPVKKSWPPNGTRKPWRFRGALSYLPRLPPGCWSRQASARKRSHVGPGIPAGDKYAREKAVTALHSCRRGGGSLKALVPFTRRCPRRTSRRYSPISFPRGSVRGR